MTTIEPETLYIPRAEDYEPLRTRPIPLPEALCMWCRIKLTAIPDQPVWSQVNNGWYHPSCHEAYKVGRFGA